MARRIAVLLPLVLAATALAEERRIVHAELTRFGYLYVVEEGDLRILRLEDVDGDDQSMMSLSDPDAVPMEYVRYALVAVAYVDPPGRMLMVGLGGGSYTNLLWKRYPKIEIDAVEINPAVVRVARAYFSVPDHPRYRIHVQDGKAFLQGAKQAYDLVFLDAYTGAEDMPRHLTTKVFFSLVRTRLTPTGVAAINISTETPVEKAIARRFRTVFPGAQCFRTPEDNLIVVGRRDDRKPARAELVGRASRITLDRKLPFDLGEVATHLGACP